MSAATYIRNYLCLTLLILAPVFSSQNICAFMHGEIIDMDSPQYNIWYTSKSRIDAYLITQEMTIEELVEKAHSITSKEPLDIMFKLSVFMRANMSEDAIAALKELKQACPDLNNSEIQYMYSYAIHKAMAMDIAKAIVEVFADNISDISLGNLTQHLKDSGWSVEKIDTWMSHMPEGKRMYWLRERLQFTIQNDYADALINTITDRIRKNPHDIDFAIVFLDALQRSNQNKISALDLSWMTNCVKPKLTTDARRLSSYMLSLGQKESAVEFCRQAVNIPLTDEETRMLAMNYAAIMSPERLQINYSVNIREQMAECMLAADRLNDAQKWMIEAADIREQNNLGKNTYLARRIQEKTGQDTAESNSKKDEEKSDATSEKAVQTVNTLLRKPGKHIKADDVVLWNWLESRPKWDYDEERLLIKMLLNVEQVERPTYFKRIEKLVEGNDPSRSLVFGAIMKQMQFPKHALTHIQYALKNTDDEELKKKAYRALYETYLYMNDWKNAEELLPHITKHHNSEELSIKYSNLAIAAAKAGAKEDALRLWKKAVNLKPSTLYRLEALVKKGLGKQLEAYYRELQNKMPNSQIPKKALAIINKDKATEKTN